MSSRPITVQVAPPMVTACSLKHHRPGERVVFSKWCPEQRATVKYTGRVVTHVPDARIATVAVEPSGRRHLIECGAVAASP